MASFLITSHGRSGTTWCARELNRSMDWLVTHEGFTSSVITDHGGYPELTNRRGDVDSRCRLVALDILDAGKIGKLAVILRDPTDIIMSALGRNNPSAFARIVSGMPRDLFALDVLARDNRVHVIKFADMVLGTHAWRDMACFLGVADLPRCTDTTPANGPTQEFLPPTQKKRFQKKFQWFTERHGL